MEQNTTFNTPSYKATVICSPVSGVANRRPAGRIQPMEALCLALMIIRPFLPHPFSSATFAKAVRRRDKRRPQKARNPMEKEADQEGE